ncbi:CoA-binding protein [Anoxybacillus suryakundensis]|uniref:Predicted CoA-binding protein n=1 Tax=Anoxybacillus suryakundensis TaxID=1325335 RepID=A0A0K6GQ46_9BACL|nr:CoA-binding protein [Anoxybacillus suryakundensis]CUA80636.1 Predicted CoA-binding protein [Anoxybacillus suryakundensis]
MSPSREQIKQILNKAKRIAVVGLSDHPNRTSYMVAKAMKEAGYEIIPVNPLIKEWEGIRAVATLTDIEGHVDIVNVFRRSEHLREIAEQFVQMDADVFWAQLGVYDEEVYRDLTEKGYTVVMDRCIKVEHALTR